LPLYRIFNKIDPPKHISIVENSPLGLI
jgi:hypothetical protein